MSLTLADLRNELQSFAQTTLQRELNHQFVTFKQSILNDFASHMKSNPQGGRPYTPIKTGPTSRLHAYNKTVTYEGHDLSTPQSRGGDDEESMGLLSPEDPTPRGMSSTKGKKKKNTAPATQLASGKLPGKHVYDPNTWAGILMNSELFTDTLTTGMVIANILFIALETSMQASDWGAETPELFRIIGHGFCLFFCLEISARLTYFGKEFFAEHSLMSNVFDLILVVLQVMEEVVAFCSWVFHLQSESLLAVYRLVRILRLLRILRILRLVMSLGELRMIIVSISNSMKSLVWVMVLVFLLTFAAGLFLTQLTTEHRIASENTGVEADDDLTQSFGSLGGSILVLYEAISEGTNCPDLLQPLMEHISPIMSVPFVMYTSFVTFAMMNVITSSFVESAFRAAKDDENNLIMGSLTAMFAADDVEGEEALISREEFNEALEKPEMVRYLSKLEISPEMAKDCDFFALIDADGSGSVDNKELVDSCLRLTNGTRCLDLQMFVHESRLDRKQRDKQQQKVDTALSLILDALSARR